MPSPNGNRFLIRTLAGAATESPMPTAVVNFTRGLNWDGEEPALLDMSGVGSIRPNRLVLQQALPDSQGCVITSTVLPQREIQFALKLHF